MLFDLDITPEEGAEFREFLALLKPTSHQTAVDNGFDLDAMRRTARAILSRKRLLPNQIWFVDHPERYHIFLSMCGMTTDSDSIMSPGHDIHNWESRFFDPDLEMIAFQRDSLEDMLKRSRFEKAVWPWICAHPGVWAQFSDGSWRKLDIDATPWREIADGIRAQWEILNK